MYDFYVKVLIYLICFILSNYALSAFDFNRFIKQGKVTQGQLLYVFIACSLTYLVANFIMAIIYHFN